MNKNPNDVRLAVITATTPRCLTKKFTLRKGELQKHAGGILVEGFADVVSVEGLSAFRKLLRELRTNQALSYGIPAAASVRLTTKEKWLEEGRPEGTIPRTADMFRWPEGGGVLMLDYDPPPDGIPLNREDLVSALRRAVPGLCDAAMLWWPSASSFIINTETGQQVRGLRGQRLYILVANASDIPRAGKAFTEALWAAGSGYFAVSTSGSLLSRTIFDGSVWQTNRLDFAAGAACRAPLRQERGEPVLVPGVVEFVDTETAIPDPTAEIKAEAHAARDRTRDAVRAEGEAVREAWIEDRVGKLVPDNADDDTRDAARATVRRAVENSTLSGNFTVQVMEGNETRAVTVVEVLDDPSRYDGMLTLDPLEPDYDGGRVVGKLYTAGTRPNLFSFAHGGRTFRLMRHPARIEIVKGRTYDVVQASLETLRRASEAFDFGGALVTVDRGRVHPLDDAGLIHFLGGVVQYWRWNSARRAEPSGTLEDPPPRVAKQILSLGAGRRLKTLSAVVTVPTLRPDGTVFDTPGYDEATGLLFEATEDVVPVPSAPDREEVVEALETLLHPFREFPVVAPDDWGVLLAALLTAVVRPALPTAPGFGFDAPVQGSGKTLLANCVGVLASGQAPAVWPHTAGKDDEEVRKRLFAALRQGYRALVWDNVVGTFNSAAMSAALTSSNFTDRILGKSESISVPNKAILLMTGNNLTLAGDMARRVLTCRIDPGTDHPFAREFDLDPLVHTRKHRQEMAAAGLTIVRGWMTADAERAPGRMASFEMWDDIVRQAVAWVGREIRPGQFGDPMNAVFTAQSGDPEQETLGEMLLAWRELFGGDPVSSGEVLEVVSPVYGFQPTGSEASLRDCLREFSERAIVSKKSLGRALGYRVGRIVGGLKLEGNKDPHTKTNLWRVAEVD